MFWRVGPLYYRLPLLGECSRNPSVSVYQLVLLWEAELGFSEFFWRLIQHVCPFYDGWAMNVPAHTTLRFGSFWPKMAWPLLPHPPYSPSLAPSNFFLFPHMKQVLKGEHFASVEQVKQSGRRAKRHQNQQVQKLFWAVEKSLNRWIASKREYFKGVWSLNMYK